MGRTTTVPLKPGERFGRLTVVMDPYKGWLRKCLVRCKCGRKFWTRTSNLLIESRAADMSCGLEGCRGSSGMFVKLCRDPATRKRLAARVRNAIGRCTSKRDKQWHRYGGRGIRVFAPWLKDRRAFFAYLMTLPGWDDPKLILDRADNDGHYEPGNLRFVTPSVSTSNREPRRRAKP